MTLKVGPKALATIHHFEDCRLSAYRDAVGIPTIGWGMTYYPDGRRVKIGERITQAQADSMFETLLERDFAAPVRKLIGVSPTTPAQFGAMVALAYNIGIGAFTGSSVLKRHKAGDTPLRVTEAFLMWNKAGGKVLSGLVRRRNAEAALYRSDFAALAIYTQGKVK